MDFTQKINKPWIDPEDLLDRKKYADYLTNYLNGQEKPFVLNVNADWGLGKTFFLRSWSEDLKDSHPVVYINAWENDFSDDPLLTVLSSIKSELSDHFKDTTEAKAALSQIFKSSGRFLKKITPIIAKGLVSKALGDEAANDCLNISTPDALDETVSDVAGQATEVLLQDHELNSRNMHKFRESLRVFLEKVITDSEKSGPVYIYIDELDRCRPTYAIELLETVKHLFTVDKTVFIIATDSLQLQHSICAIYGNSFNGAEYLRRFFDREFTLPMPSFKQIIGVFSEKIDDYDRFLGSPFIPTHRNGDKSDTHTNPKKDFCNWFDFYATSFEVPIRSLIQIFHHFMVIMSNSENKTWQLPFLLFLLFLYTKHRDIFNKAESTIKKSEDTKEVEEILPTSHESVHWLYYDQFEGNSRIDTFHNIKDIGRAFISNVASLHAKSPTKYRERANDPSTINNFIAECLMRQKAHHNNAVFFLDYFSAIRMSGYIT
ncbi:MAG: KAP family NTPase [Candidatus Thiodiazotropha sp. (ex Clathrolucina costata)]|nr:KAP family NTPase [Candidatus Thiodiazotropha taylori]